MYEENERFSWTSLFIKIIIVVIFVLFTIWLLQLSMKSATKDMSNGINVLTNNIFSQNVDRMKDVGTSYFTTERLPKKVGETKTITLEDMYKENLILELKDKNGNSCNMENSYVSVEKLDSEYQMKVYLDCGDESNFIKVIMGCYNYCDSDICEKKEATKALEYEYAKSTGGSWGPWGNWTGWSTTAVSGNDGREVDTKTVTESYTHDEPHTETKLVGTADICPKVDGYSLIANKDGVCTYSKTATSTVDPTCPTVDGYKNTGRDGFTCKYSKTSTASADPTCPTVDGYKNTGRDGFTCTYSKTSTSTTNPTCPSVDGYTNTGRNGFTCNYSKSTTSTVAATCTTTGGDPIYGQKCTKVAVGTKIVSACTGCAKEVQTIYETRCNTVVTGYTATSTKCTCPSGYSKTNTTCTKTTTSTTTKDAQCPSGYTKSGDTCAKTTSSTTTKDAQCPSGYTKSGNTCAKTTSSTTTKDAQCPSGYTKNGNTCTKTTTATTTKDAKCPSGYEKAGNTCVKNNTSTTTKSATCPSDQKLKDGKCYKEVTTVVPVTETKKVTYYRYRLRDYNGGATDYKWSPSDHDQSLLDAGYKLTGKTREVGGTK